MSRKIVRKWFWVWDFDKEEIWLNEMAKQGWLLEKVGYARYEFSSCEPGAYAVRLEMLENAPDSEKGKDYIAFVEDTGAEYIGSVLRWVYFRKKAENGGFDLFSDIDSRIRHLNTIMALPALLGAANLAIGAGGLERLGWINILCAALMGYGWLRLKQKRDKLNNERTLHE